MPRISEYHPIRTTLIAVFVIISTVGLLGNDIAVRMSKDNGLIQILTACLLCVVVALALLRVLGRQQPLLSWIETTYILSIYAMREMDFHRLFTDEHITRLKLYTRAYPLEQKLIGGAIMILFIIVVLHFTATHARIFFKRLKEKNHRARYIVVWAFLLGGAQIIDKPHLFSGYLKTLTEETMELGAALMMLFIMLSFPLDLKRLFRRTKVLSDQS